MSCLTCLVDKVYVVRWIQPNLADAQRVLAELESASKTLGGALIFIGIADQHTKPPDEDVRRIFSQNTDRILQMCQSIHMVIEGTGFRIAVLRSVATSIFMLSGKRNKIHISTTLREALGKVAAQLGSTPDVLVRHLRERQIAA